MPEQDALQVVSAPRPHPSAPDLPKIAVFRALQLGDLLCAIPALRALRAAFPRSEIVFIGLPWAEEFARRFAAYIDDFLPFPGYPGLPERVPDLAAIPVFLKEAQRRRFDLALQLHGSGSFVNSLAVLLGARLTAGYYLPGEFCPNPALFLEYPDSEPEVRRHLALMEFLGVPLRGDHLEFPVTEGDRREFALLDRRFGLTRHEYVCVHPGSQLPSRRWPPERFAAVSDILARRGFQVVLTGSASEAPLTRAVSDFMRSPALDLAGTTSLGGLAALLDGAQLLVSNDTGLSHLAAARRIPSVIVANGSDPGRWAPLDRDLHRVLSYQVSCRPCEYAVCPIGHPCALGVPPEAVVEHATALLRTVKLRRHAHAVIGTPEESGTCVPSGS